VVSGLGSPTPSPFPGSGSAADTREVLSMGGMFAEPPSLLLQSLSQAARLRSVRSESPAVTPSGVKRSYLRGASLDPVLGPSLAFSPELDLVMESASQADDDDESAATPVPTEVTPAALTSEARGAQSPADAAVRILVDKIDASASVSSIGGLISVDFKMTVMDFLKKYHADVLRLGAVATHLGKLRQHKSNGTYPTALQSIREPKIQWSHEFMAAPNSVRENFSTAATRSFTGFAETVSAAVSGIKDEILDKWIVEKKRELALFQQAAAAESAVKNLRDALGERMGDLRSRFTYEVFGQRPVDPLPLQIREIIAERTFRYEVLSRASPAIVAKVNSIVHNAEDRRLSDALKRMELSQDASRSAAETPKNEISLLAKKVADLTKKLGGKKKVCDALSPFILCSASLLPMTSSSLADYCSSLIEAAVEELLEGDEKGSQADQHQKPPEEVFESGLLSQEGYQEDETFKRWEQGFQEEEWQEIGLACDKFDSFFGLSCASLHSDSELCTSCSVRSFLHSSLPFSLVSDLVLRPFVQICAFYYLVHVLPSRRKINIFDYTTYPQIVTYMPREISFALLNFSAPDWLLGSLCYTRAVHSNLNLSIPKEVLDPLSVGLRYLWPIGFSSEKVRSSWNKLSLKASAQWIYQTETRPTTQRWSYDEEQKRLFEIKNFHPSNPTSDFELYRILEEEYKPSDEFFRLPVPFVTREQPSSAREVPWIAEAFELGWQEVDRVLQSSPTVNREGRSRAIDLNEALRWLEPNKVLVKPTDKNLGTALVSLEWYDDAICNFIRNNKGYQIIDHVQAQVRLIRQVRQIIGVANTVIVGDFPGLRSYITSRLSGLRMDESTGWRVEEPEGWIDELTLTIPLFNGLPKIHKNPWAIRPIVPCHSVIQQPASQMLSVLLKCLLPQFPWILVSSKHLCRDIEGIVNPRLRSLSRPSWRDKIFICTADIGGFYTNVNIQDCSARLKDLAEKTYGDSDRGAEKVRLITDLFHLQQDTLIFRVKSLYNDWLVAQKDGLAMGMDAAPDIANLYAATYEQELFENEPVLRDGLLLYRRYIDDIFTIVLAPNLDACKSILGRLILPGLKLNWEYSHSSGVFLDLDLWRSPHHPDQRIKYRPYRKPLNNFERLPWCTGHSSKILKAAFKSEVHRLAVLSYTPQIYSEELSWLKDLYISRGYPPLVIKKWCKKAHDYAYQNRLDWKPQEALGEGRVWPLRSTMNPVWDMLDFSSISEEISAYGLRVGESPSNIAKWRKRIVKALKRPQNMGDRENQYNRKLCQLTKEDTKINLGLQGLMSPSDSSSLEVLSPGRQLPQLYVRPQPPVEDFTQPHLRSQPPSPSRGADRIDPNVFLDV
jgi:hypothetical protein